jgi:zeaxanthin glucosyltransferase
MRSRTRPAGSSPEADVSRILIITATERGHVNPMIGVCQRLVAAGHHVGFIAYPQVSQSARRQLEASQIEVVALACDWPASWRPSPEQRQGLLRDPDWRRRWVRSGFLDLQAQLVEPTLEAIRRFEPDAIARDTMMCAAAIAADLAGVREAAVSSWLHMLCPELDCDLARGLADGEAARAELFARHGISREFRGWDCMSAWFNTIFTTEELAGELPPRTFAVGPSRPLASRGDEVLFPWERLARDRPIVLCAFGSLYYWEPELYRALAHAAASLGVQLVLALGELATESFTRELPGDVLVTPYVPQTAVLERCAAFVTHGGANSFMESLDAGVPMLLFPATMDQPATAFLAERANVGISLDRECVSEAQCRDALATLLDEHKPYRAAAARLRRAYRERDGAGEVAARLLGA